MKAQVLIFSVVLSFLSVETSRKYSGFENLAINSIISSQLASDSGKIDFVSDSTRSILRQLISGRNFLATKLNSCDSKEIRLESSTVLTFELPQEFKETFPKIKWKTFKWRNNKHLVYIANATIQDLKGLDVEGFAIDNVAFLLNKTEKSIDLVTSFMFTKQKCRKNQFVTINRFNKDTMKWESDNFYPRKYRNFHNCPVTVGITEQFNLLSFDRVMNEMSRILNFQIEKIHRKTFQDLEILSETGSCDFIRLPFNLTQCLSIVLGFEYGVFVVPPGSSLNEVEKLLLPFDTETWIWIIGTLISCFLIIQVISLLSKRTMHLCFGQNVKSTGMNFLSTFFCGGQTRVPGNSWARCIFLTFIVWSLIIRTCFQSLSYRALQMDNRHQSMKTLEDIQRSGFQQLLPLQHNEKSPKSFYGVPVEFVNANASQMLNIVAEAENKRTVFMSLELLDGLEKKDFRMGKMSHKILKNIVYSFPVTFTMNQPFHPFLEEFNDRLNCLIESGMKFRRIVKKTMFDEEVPALVLSLIPLTLSVLAFIAEVALPRIKLFGSGILGGLTAVVVISAFLDCEITAI